MVSSLSLKFKLKVRSSVLYCNSYEILVCLFAMTVTKNGCEETIDHHSYAHIFSSCEIKVHLTPKKNFGVRCPLKPEKNSGQNGNQTLCNTSAVLYRYITNLQSGQLPVGLTAQLLEHCTSITEFKIPFRPDFFKNLICFN